MKAFLIKILVFFGIPLFVYIATGTVKKISFRNTINDYQTFILGDSQTMFIKSPLIYNRSIQGSPYYVHYEFVKEYINQIKGKKVYISCNYNNFSRLYQNRLLNGDLMPGWRESTFLSLDEFNLFNHIYTDIRPKDLEYSVFDIRKVARFLNNAIHPNKIENTLNSVINDTLSIGSTIHRHWLNSSYIHNDSIQEVYLKKIITKLKVNNCDIILLKMPLTNYYIDNVPSEIKSKIAQISKSYNVRLLDLNKLLMLSDKYEYFKDYGHMNTIGDSIVNEFLIRNEIY